METDQERKDRRYLDALNAIAAMQLEDRPELFREFCVNCGSMALPCYCEYDE